MKGNIRKTEHIIKAKIFEATAYRNRLSKAKANKYFRSIRKDSTKASKDIEQDVQNTMRKATRDIISATVWNEDWQDLSEAVFEHCKTQQEEEE